MKKSIVTFCILALSLVAGAVYGEEKKENIIIAYSFCSENCRYNLKSCKTNSCGYLRGSDILYNNCLDSCMEEYDRCMMECARE